MKASEIIDFLSDHPEHHVVLCCSQIINDKACVDFFESWPAPKGMIWISSHGNRRTMSEYIGVPVPVDYRCLEAALKIWKMEDCKTFEVLSCEQCAIHYSIPSPS